MKMFYFTAVLLILGATWMQSQAKDACAGSVCRNKALCVRSFSDVDYTCECQRGWEGDYCELVSDYKRQNLEEVPLIAGRPVEAFESFPPGDSQTGPAQSEINSQSAWIPTTGYSHIETNAIDKPRPSLSIIDAAPWLQVQFDTRRQIHRVVTRGSPTSYDWVTKYTIAHRLNYGQWFMIYNVREGVEQVYTANTDQNTAVSNHVPGHRSANFIRLYPVAWHGRMAVRWEIYGCAAPMVVEETTVAEVEETTTTDESEEESDEDSAMMNHVTAHVLALSCIIARLFSLAY